MDKPEKQLAEELRRLARQMEVRTDPRERQIRLRVNIAWGVYCGAISTGCAFLLTYISYPYNIIGCCFGVILEGTGAYFLFRYDRYRERMAILRKETLEALKGH